MPAMRWDEAVISAGTTPSIKNHTATLVDNYIYVFGGYDGRRNHNNIHIFDPENMLWLPTPTVIDGEAPAGRNGHTATIADRRIFIIGGWLGSGPLAASDMHILHVNGPNSLAWEEPPVLGTPPGPCNMHTADYIEHLGEIFVFRGGDGREYLNDLHALDVDSLVWRKVEVSGQAPFPRANHSSAIVGNKLIVFGGWDGQRRLNDIHVLDTISLYWTVVDPSGVLPHPRAGMTFTCLRDKVFLFGGSGPSAKCFNDLQVFDSVQSEWIETVQFIDNEAESESAAIAHATLYSARECGDGDANPNDHSHHHQIMIVGHGPGKRAGHTCTAVDRKLFVFGGSYGISLASSTQILQHSLKHFLNSGEFSDISFVVEGRVVQGHRVILSLLSDRFRAMFSAGFRESEQSEIVIQDIRYDVFIRMMEYLYTGSLSELTAVGVIEAGEQPSDENMRRTFSNLEIVLELLSAADQFMLDNLKQLCEKFLQETVTEDTVEYLLEAAERNNAFQLKAVCLHFIRNECMKTPPKS